MEKRQAFRSGRALIQARIVLFALAFAAFGVLLAIAPDTPLLPTLLVAAILGVGALVFALSPALTEHWLTRSRLILRQGWYFRAVLRLADLDSLRPVEADAPYQTPLGIHRPLGKPVLYVTGGRTGLLIARLREPRRFWQSFGLDAEEIVFDVADREAFLRAFEERRGSLAPVKP